MRKKLILLVLLGLVSLTGCVQMMPPEQGETAHVRNQVNIWHYWGDERQQQELRDVIEAYNASQDDQEVLLTYVPFEDFRKKLSVGAASGDLPDIAILALPDHAYYASIGIFADLGDRMDLSGYYPDAVTSCTIDGRLYGVPFGSNCLALIYNADLLAHSGVNPPATWEELADAAGKLTRDNVKGIAFSCAQNEEGTFNELVWLLSAGADALNLNTPEGIRALSFVEGLVRSGSMDKDVINWSQAEVMEQFGQGNIAMMVNGSWQVPILTRKYPDLHYGVALIPEGKLKASVLGGENYAVIAGRNEVGALDFIRFATEKTRLAELMNRFGYISADRAVAQTQYPDDENMAVFIREMQYAKSRGPHIAWPKISEVISRAFLNVILEIDTPERAAEKAQALLNEIVSG